MPNEYGPCSTPWLQPSVAKRRSGLFRPNLIIGVIAMNSEDIMCELGQYFGFYRAMHFSAKRGIAIACRLSVRPSVCLSVCLSVCNVGEL